ncbi:TetR family transcriptional regulator [Propioniciclava coleopterorum]|uniref:TetR family transcriptional regulator n=1 Tax=Propioniciclava coleopterorum TaxID=2714937 RepID=A0A6G7Y4E1_9ACTN|nr:TetR family transcriptional regulator [Propioniciclava coleopterorum]QIK71653.1 TetR family transcriptional regulator [Propioniciclava coleopterorum]
MARDVRERAREAVRTEIAQALSDLFAARGFDAVTVEEAAREVGISRATFFRYFGSKEDAVIAAMDGVGVDFGAVLDTLDPVAGESAWGLLLRTFQRTLEGVDESSDADRARLRMIHSTPSLRGRLTARRVSREDSLADALTRRGVPLARAQAAAAAGLAGLDVTWRRWANGTALTMQRALADTFADLAATDTPL